MKENVLKLPTWPSCSAEEIAAVAKVLKSGKVNYWTGEECELFEKEIADFIGVPYAISLANGTVALEVALRTLDITSADEVIVPCRTFIATASSVVACGAKPICADVDPCSQNLTPKTIARVLTPKTRAIIVVHLAGWPCDMDAILEFANQHRLKVIEDCAQACGAKYRGKRVGFFGDAATFSFCQDKIITTGGEGGMLVTKSQDIWRKAWAYKDHGKNPRATSIKRRFGVFRWVHDSFGSNFRMTEMQAAIGRTQLRKLPQWLQLRKRNADILTNCFKNISALRTTVPAKGIEHAYYKYYAFLKLERLKRAWDRKRLLKAMNCIGIPCGSGVCGEIYLEKAFVDFGLKPQQRFPVAKGLSETSLMFPVHPTLSESDMHKVATEIKKIFAKAMK